MLMKSAITPMRRANGDEDITGFTAFNLFTVVAQKHLEFRYVRARAPLLLHSLASIFRSLARIRRARNRFAAPIIVRLFSYLSVQEQEEQRVVVRIRSFGGRLRGPLGAVQEIACGTTHLQRASVTLYCVAAREFLVVCRFFPTCSRARTGQIRRARCNRGRNERVEILPA